LPFNVLPRLLGLLLRAAVHKHDGITRAG